MEGVLQVVVLQVVELDHIQLYLHTIIQKLHYDYIIISAFGDSVIAPLTFIDDNFLWYETTSGTLRVLKKFNNNKTSDDYGTPNAYQPSSGSDALSTTEANKSLKDYVDSGKIGYYGGSSSSGSSSSSGVEIGNADVFKDKVTSVELCQVSFIQHPMVIIHLHLY